MVERPSKSKTASASITQTVLTHGSHNWHQRQYDKRVDGVNEANVGRAAKRPAAAAHCLDFAVRGSQPRVPQTHRLVRCKGHTAQPVQLALCCLRGGNKEPSTSGATQWRPACGCYSASWLLWSCCGGLPPDLGLWQGGIQVPEDRFQPDGDHAPALASSSDARGSVQPGSGRAQGRQQQGCVPFRQGGSIQTSSGQAAKRSWYKGRQHSVAVVLPSRWAACLQGCSPAAPRVPLLRCSHGQKLPELTGGQQLLQVNEVHWGKRPAHLQSGHKPTLRQQPSPASLLHPMR